MVLCKASEASRSVGVLVRSRHWNGIFAYVIYWWICNIWLLLGELWALAQLRLRPNLHYTFNSNRKCFEISSSIYTGLIPNENLLQDSRLSVLNLVIWWNPICVKANTKSELARLLVIQHRIELYLRSIPQLVSSLFLGLMINKGNIQLVVAARIFKWPWRLPDNCKWRPPDNFCGGCHLL